MPDESDGSSSPSLGSSPASAGSKPPRQHAQDDGLFLQASDPEGLVKEEDSDHERHSGHERDSDPEPNDRPNRFKGAPSTWRDWTASERLVAHSVHQAEAGNLSVHLYNAHRLHVRAYLGLGDAEEGGIGWRPHKSWTAWPPSYLAIPRERRGRSTYLGVPTLRNPVKTSPRQDLAEALIAFTSKEARERFNAREPESPYKQGAQASDHPDADRHESEPTASMSSREPHGLEVSEITMHDASDIASEADELDENADQLAPHPLEDDEEIASLLQGPVGHVLSQVDNLLVALHYSRASYDQPSATSSSAEGDETDTRASSSAGETRGRRQRLKRNLSHGSSTQPKRRQSAAQSKTRRREGRSQSSVSSVRSERSRQMMLGQRGWDDVLAFADMVGWDRDVLARTRARCTQLFGNATDEGAVVRFIGTEGSEPDAEEDGDERGTPVAEILGAADPEEESSAGEASAGEKSVKAALTEPSATAETATGESPGGESNRGSDTEHPDMLES